MRPRRWASGSDGDRLPVPDLAILVEDEAVADAGGHPEVLVDVAGSAEEVAHAVVVDSGC